MSDQSIIHVVGNRPQFIKLAVLHEAIRELSSHPQCIIHTGQHSAPNMSDLFFDELMIPEPDHHLHVRADGAHSFIGAAATQISGILEKRNVDDIVMVYGDTNSTLAAALAAARSGRKLVHFESGVRTADASMPEEINRVLTDRLAQVHYCCTEKNRRNLLHEGFGSFIESKVVWSGDLMLDAFQKIAPAEKGVVAAGGYVACTIHRAANIGERKYLNEIVSALNRIHKEVEVIIPLHPHTARRLREFHIVPEFSVIDPLSYRQMKRFIGDAAAVITDSGGTSREAFFAQKKSLIIMQHPFWPEIIESGSALNCDAVEHEIVKNFGLLQILKPDFGQALFGDGDAARKIALHLSDQISV